MDESPLLIVLRDATRALAAEPFEHALIGGVAAIFHGSTRATRDVDLSVVVPTDRIPALTEALERSGFGDLVQRGSVIQARHRTGYRLDLLQTGSRFERQLVADARPHELHDGWSFPLARLEDVVAFKIVGGRPRDLRDIEELAEVNAPLGWSRVLDNLVEFGVHGDAVQLERAAQRDELRPMLKSLVRQLRG